MNIIIKVVISIQILLILGLVLLLTGVVDSTAIDTTSAKLSRNNSVPTSTAGINLNKESSIGSFGFTSSLTTENINQEINTINSPVDTGNQQSFWSNASADNRGNGLAIEINNSQEYPDTANDEFEEQPKLQELTGFKHSSLSSKINNSLIPSEIYEIQVSDGLWGYFANPNDRLERLKKIDPGLILINYRSEEFKNSVLEERMSLSPTSKIYVLLEFKKAIDPQMINSLRGLGFGPVPVLKQINYYKKHAGVFYVKYNKLKNIYRSPVIKDIHILANYTATAKYELGIRSTESTDNLEIKISYPYSKPGLKISNLIYRFEGEEHFTEQDIKEHNQLIVKTPVIAGRVYRFLSRHLVDVSLLDNINRNFVVAAKNLNISDYEQGMEKYPDIKEIFTRQGEKIVPSTYVKNIVSQIDLNMDLSGIWKQITFILDKDIEYDWQKRELFFSGNLPYYDIKDMYLNVEELSEKKVGVCTERTALEISILRELGIASRSATRGYHIFTEVFVPEQGWVTTSMILNEVPLCHSYDENMAYFVQWNKKLPIHLKWVVKMYPSIISDYLVDESLVKN